MLPRNSCIRLPIYVFSRPAEALNTPNRKKLKNCKIILNKTYLIHVKFTICFQR